MFEALRKNIQTVQDGISAGLHRLSVGDKTPTTPTDSKLEFGVGADVLELYQTQWATMHHLAEQTANQAEKIDGQITNLVEECETQHNQVVEIHSLLAHLPNIMSQLHSMLSTIGSVRNLLEEVESEVTVLADLKEELNLQEKTLDMRLNIALTREKQNHKLSQLKDDLSQNHKAKMILVDQAKEEQRKQKQKDYDSRFLQDIKEFKETGTVKSTMDLQKNEDEMPKKLEDIVLDEDLASLDSFLEKST